MTDYRNITIKNKRAAFDYEILETWTAGIVLTGTEIKSLRLGKASMVDCYCYVDRGEIYLRGLNISEYHWGTYNNHQPRRDRKLLLQKREINKIARALQDKGLTVVGMRVFINDRGLAKAVIGLGRGRKSYDKRDYIKEKDIKRELDRTFKK
ncbi:MAG: SsrA-binding protein SmpB [Rikenellaceae bacterium]|nr:SsrA-binding protein SmpB [Rikenellaceae bacterium]